MRSPARGGQRPARAGRHLQRPDGQVGFGLRGPRIGRRRRRRGRCRAGQAAGDAGDLGLRAVGVGGHVARDVLRPQHREVRLGHLAARRQVEPDLEQLQRVRRVGVEQREHLRVHDAAAGGEPLHVAAAEARRRRRASRSGRSGPCARWSRSRSRGAGAAGSRAPCSPWYMRQPSLPAKSWPRSRPASDASGPSCALPRG